MRKNGIVIAIDGPAGAGKSTTARLVAEALGYVYLDTGAMYRAVGLAALQQGVDLENARAVAKVAREISIGLERDNNQQRTFLNEKDVSTEIRSSEASIAASQVAAHQAVRNVLVARQRALGAQGGIVLEGRDTGTAIFPDAELKVFLVADPTERARRRHKELIRRGENSDLESLMTTIHQRDARDQETQQRLGPWPSKDAVKVDTTGLSITEQVQCVVALAKKRGA